MLTNCWIFTVLFNFLGKKHASCLCFHVERINCFLIILIGMGVTDSNDQIATDRLKDLRLEYVPEDTCKEELKPSLLGQFTICASDSRGMSDVCRGDR
jgi:hypothetical protein